jgi:ankyrin repeat protein
MHGKAPPILILLFVLAGAAAIHFMSANVSDPPIVSAAKQNDLPRLAALLYGGADPNAHDRHRNTALIYAARDGRYDMAETLIAKGADIDWQDGEWVTPLILASHKNHPKLVRLLLTHKADRDIRDKWARTALDYALRRGEDDAIAKMLQSGS